MNQCNGIYATKQFINKHSRCLVYNKLTRFLSILVNDYQVCKFVLYSLGYHLLQLVMCCSFHKLCIWKDGDKLCAEFIRCS